MLWLTITLRSPSMPSSCAACTQTCCAPSQLVPCANVSTVAAVKFTPSVETSTDSASCGPPTSPCRSRVSSRWSYDEDMVADTVMYATVPGSTSSSLTASDTRYESIDPSSSVTTVLPSLSSSTTLPWTSSEIVRPMPSVGSMS